MARFFFHLRDGVDIVLDDEGRDLPDKDAIAALALVDARSILADEIRRGQLRLDLRIDVEDEQGALVHRLPFADAVEIIGAPPA